MERPSLSVRTTPPLSPHIAVSVTMRTPLSITCRCRHSATREGSRQRPSSASSQPSSDQPSRNGVSRPRGSTIGSSAQSGWPIAVQLRWLRLMWVMEKARGMNDASFGSN